jgi:hypothetical protein
VNIIDEILQCVSSTSSGRTFAFSSATEDVIRKFNDSLIDFLKSSTYYEREHRCGEIYSLMLDLHDKVPMLLPMVGRLNNEELFGSYYYRDRRLHYCHQAYVFLLGLLNYHNFEPLRKTMAEEMRETTTELECPDGSFFRYSGGNEYGEFLYRWRLASLCHDLGTGIQLSEGRQDQIARNLTRLPFQKPINSIEQLQAFGEHDLLADIENASGAVKLSKYMEYQSSNPYSGNVHHDHGIIANLIFLRLMYEAYARHRDNQISINMEGVKVFWGPEILSHSIIQIAKAVSLHNIDNYPETFGKFSTTARFLTCIFRH